MAGCSGATRQKLAWAFIFLLAAREVSAAREMYRGAKLSSLQATTLGRAGEDFQRAEAVREDRSFSVRTMWATGKASSLLWSDSTITFRYVAGNTSAHEPPKYVEIDGLDTKYRLMPDGAAVIKEVHGMDTVSIVGWQAYEAASGATPSTQRMRPCTSGLTTTPPWAKPSPIGAAARWGMWSTRVTASSTSSTAKASRRSSRRTR
ncbi:unnamed protein product [Effrenium voratum]|nr:unnamed protein product [Effrenium voratum]